MAASESVSPGAIASPRTARVAVAAIFCVNGALMATWFSRIPDVKQQLGLSEGALSLALLCAAVGALIAQPTAGWVIGRLGSRILTSVLALLFCAVVILPSISPGLPVLMVSLLALGAANGGLDVSMNAQAALVERHYGRSIMNSFHALWSLGGLAGAAAGALAASRGLPVFVHFALGAGVGVLLMLAALRGLVSDAPVAGGSTPAFALPTRALIPMGIVALSVLICEGAIGDWGAIYLREGLAASAALAAIGYAVFAMMMAGGRFTGDWLATRFGSGQIVRAGGLLIVVGVGLAILSVDRPWVAIIGYGLIGAGASCIFPLILSAAARTPGVAPGIGIAAMATAGYTGFLLGPPLIGGLAEVVTLRGSLGVLALFGVLIIVLGSTVQGQAHTQAVAAD